MGVWDAFRAAYYAQTSTRSTRLSGRADSARFETVGDRFRGGGEPDPVLVRNPVYPVASAMMINTQDEVSDKRIGRSSVNDGCGHVQLRIPRRRQTLLGSCSGLRCYRGHSETWLLPLRVRHRVLRFN